MNVKTKTPEQKKAEREALLDQLHQKITSLTTSEEWGKYLRFLASFRNYSPRNILLIMTQFPKATRVAGYRKWQELGRHVCKGERAIKIIGYSTKTITTQDDDERSITIPSFPILSVFDIAQTEGDPIPNDSYAFPDGDDPEHIADRITAWLTAEHWMITTAAITNAEGSTDHQAKTITIRDGLTPAAHALVLLHEAAHAILHIDLTRAEYHTRRGVWETEAESVAYVLACLLGLDPDASSVPYIASWSVRDPGAIETTASRVLAAVNTIAEGIQLDGPADDS